MVVSSTHEFQPPEATFLPPPWIPSPWGRAPKKPWRREAKGRRSPMMTGGGEATPRAAAGAALRSSLPSPPSSPPSPSPTPPCIQWFILPQTSVPSYVNMVFDAIIFILWSMTCLRSYLSFDCFVECMRFIRVVCWYGTVLWCPLYLCVHGSTP